MAINEIPNNVIDYKNLLSWREIKVNNYLKNGSMEYSWTSINWYWKVWNKVIFAHSSYWKTDNWRYKTDFQKIIELDSGEEIWVYVKINWEFKRFKYKVKNSYNTKPTDVKVLSPWIGKNLTLFTCTPIWWIAWRWVIEAKYIDDNKIELQNKIKFDLIDRKIKIKIHNVVNKIWNINEKNKKKTILKIFNSIISKEKQLSKMKETEKIKYLKTVLKYLKYKLALEYYK
jgi:LPXTG-site transpeptidase (sortase) family protein